MKFNLVIDKSSEPSVTVVCDKVTSTVSKIEQLCKAESDQNILYGYQGGEIRPIELWEVTCFFTKNGKVFARIDSEEYATKIRIKDVEEMTDDSFVKINQGCVANVSRIKKFTATLGAGLKVIFDDESTDFVSRREVTNVKRRFGL
ncbi:MAG: LytTR family transcriptional regulator [Clostridia bacterium]|nr:LytTR family transcriptional regulator [Clostridia bacterium]